MTKSKRELIHKICPQCHKTFDTYTHAKKYCCRACGEQYRYTHDGFFKNKQRLEKIEAAKQQILAGGARQKLNKLKREKEIKEKFDAIAKVQEETGINYGYLVPYWNDKVALADYIAKHRTK